MTTERVYVVTGAFGDIIGVYTTRRRAKAAIRRRNSSYELKISEVTMDVYPEATEKYLW